MNDRSRVLLVDDDPGILRLLSFRLRSAGYEVEAVDSGSKALARLRGFQPQVVITDLRMDGMDGMALFDSIHAERPALPVIILTAHGTIPEAVQATQRGLHGFFTKPCDSDRLLGCVRRALRVGGGGQPDEPDAWHDRIVTQDPDVLALIERARLAARSGAPVLISGADGTGKEQFARAIHEASGRAGFVAINCRAVPVWLAEADVSGSRDGKNGLPGPLEKVHGGTLFLDEVAEMPLPAQAHLLGLLRENELTPAEDPRHLDVRLVTSTSHDLSRAAAAGQLREDLFHHLNGVHLKMPSLPERRRDIPLLARHFLEQERRKFDTPVREFAPDAMDALLSASWPGNVRQLEHVVEQSVALCTSPVIPRSLVLDALNDSPGEVPTLNEARDRFERQYLVRILRSTRGNVSHAARVAGRDRSKFYKLLRRHDLDPGTFRAQR